MKNFRIEAICIIVIVIFLVLAILMAKSDKVSQSPGIKSLAEKIKNNKVETLLFSLVFFLAPLFILKRQKKGGIKITIFSIALVAIGTYFILFFVCSVLFW